MMFGPGDFQENEMNELLSTIKTDSLQYRDIGVTSQDKIIALSTCSDASTNARTLVFGRLKEISVSEGGVLEE